MGLNPWVFSPAPRLSMCVVVPKSSLHCNKTYLLTTRSLPRRSTLHLCKFCFQISLISRIPKLLHYILQQVECLTSVEGCCILIMTEIMKSFLRATLGKSKESRPPSNRSIPSASGNTSFRPPEPPKEAMARGIFTILSPRRAPVAEAKPSNLVVPPADLPKQRKLAQKVKPKEVRELCELVRKRYMFDLELHGLRQAHARDHKEIWPTIEKADATLHKIRRTVESWNKREFFESEYDWDIFKDIRDRINLGGKRDWIADPPWSSTEKYDHSAEETGEGSESFVFCT